jgi:hypothetical protein
MSGAAPECLAGPVVIAFLIRGTISGFTCVPRCPPHLHVNGVRELDWQRKCRLKAAYVPIRTPQPESSNLARREEDVVCREEQRRNNHVCYAERPLVKLSLSKHERHVMRFRAVHSPIVDMSKLLRWCGSDSINKGVVCDVFEPERDAFSPAKQSEMRTA